MIHAFIASVRNQRRKKLYIANNQSYLRYDDISAIEKIKAVISRRQQSRLSA